MSVLLFLVVLFVLILVHEFGHFITAKWSKMRVDEFAIGFPPRVFSWTKNETRYSLNLLPIGGYVKIFGENSEDEVNYHDKARAFNAKPRHLQALVLIAGIAMNILTAWVIFYAVAIIGTPTLSETSESAELTVINVLPNSPAERAGIPLGSEIVQVGNSTEQLEDLSPSNFTSFINKNSDSDINITYKYKNEEFTKTLRAETGVITQEPDREVIGVATAFVKIHKDNPIQAIKTATQKTVDTLVAIVIGVTSLFASIFTLNADLSQVTGPIGIAGMVGEAAEFGLTSLLTFTALISLNLAVINLLPIPALDGGRLVFVLIESITRKPINPVWMGRVNLIGFSLLMLLMLTITYQDILRLI